MHSLYNKIVSLSNKYLVLYSSCVEKIICLSYIDKEINLESHRIKLIFFYINFHVKNSNAQENSQES